MSKGFVTITVDLLPDRAEELLKVESALIASSAGVLRILGGEFEVFCGNLNTVIEPEVEGTSENEEVSVPVAS